MDRRILRRDGTGIAVLEEQRIPLEADLQEAFVRHPDAIPSSDLGLGPLVSLGWELDLGAGPMDHLAVDTNGQLVIIEYKKGTENPDVRQVVAQLLDYGSALWRTSVEDLQQCCADNGRYTLLDAGVTIADHLGAVTAGDVDPETFSNGVQRCLDEGSFVFLYVARDLDNRTRRILTYLAEGPRLRFFALEVDWFAATDGTAVLVPRVAYVPATVAAGETPQAPPDPAVAALIERIDAIASQAGVRGFRAETGRRWGAPPLLGVYRTSAGVCVYLPEIQAAAGEHTRTAIRNDLENLFPDQRLAPEYPYLAPDIVLARWATFSAIVATVFDVAAGSDTQADST